MLQGDCSRQMASESGLGQGVGFCLVRWTSAQVQMQEEDRAENT